MATVTENRPFSAGRSALKYALTYEGWRMVLLGFICIVFAFGASTATMPLIYGEAIDEFGWSRTAATLIFTYKNVASAIMALFLVGPMIERFGLKAVMVGSCAVTAAGMTAFLWINSLWSYYLAGFLIGLGVTTVLIAAKVFVSRWFIRNQGLAVGVTVAGTSAGGIIFPILGSVMIDAFGWRIAFASLSLGIWCVALPLYAWKAKDDPSDADILPDAMHRNSNPGFAEKIKSADLDTTFLGLLRTPMFWIIIVSLLLVSAVDSGVFQHTILFLERGAGLDNAVAAASMSATFGLGIIAKVLAGKFYDVLSIKGISIWYIFLALSVALAFPVAGMLTLVIFTTARGMAHGGLVSETPILAKHCYGPRLMNYAMPVFTGIWAVGSAIGPVILSLIYDGFGSYSYGFLVFILMCFVAAGLLTMARPVYRQRLEALE